ncbi:glycoside hydrolase family 113 [Rhodopseudomonas sp. NSM]|uniref:glycoside hydrolase family 113 n=1 Tax=Rhodopseudomonas sp. NSM TaxID=3457630 RepID=UPI0040361F53
MTLAPGRSSDRCRRSSPLLTALTLALTIAATSQAVAQRLDGFNLVATTGHPFGSADAERSLSLARHLGARAVAIIPFLWQPTISSSEIGSGSEMPDQALRIAIRQAHRQGLSVVVKPHIWVPESWAGAVEPDSEAAWRIWFSRYRTELERIARIAAEEGAERLSIGTELKKTSHRPEWIELIAAARRIFPGQLFYVAHNVEEAEALTFWPLLDAIGVSLYPPLGADDDRAGRQSVMRGVADRLELLSRRVDKPILVGEIGLRSAKGATAKPWESAEERVAEPDQQLQADVIADWLAALDRPSIGGVMIWRWFTDPAAGGAADTDFTVQGKPAQAVLSCAWTGICSKP